MAVSSWFTSNGAWRTGGLNHTDRRIGRPYVDVGDKPGGRKNDLDSVSLVGFGKRARHDLSVALIEGIDAVARNLDLAPRDGLDIISTKGLLDRLSVVRSCRRRNPSAKRPETIIAFATEAQWERGWGLGGFFVVSMKLDFRRVAHRYVKRSVIENDSRGSSDSRDSAAALTGPRALRLDHPHIREGDRLALSRTMPQVAGHVDLERLRPGCYQTKHRRSSGFRSRRLRQSGFCS